MQTSQPNAEKLKVILWETIQDVKENASSIDKANAVAGSARALCAVVALEIKISKLQGKNPSEGCLNFIKN